MVFSGARLVVPWNCTADFSSLLFVLCGRKKYEVQQYADSQTAVGKNNRVSQAPHIPVNRNYHTHIDRYEILTLRL